MIIETKEVYKCEHCKKLYQRKDAAAKHETSCNKNPDNFRACHSCVHLIKQDQVIYEDAGHGETKREVNLLYCPVIGTYLYPPKVEQKGNAFELGDELNSPMPKECGEQQDWTDPKNW